MAISANVGDLRRYTRSAARHPSSAPCQAAGATAMPHCLNVLASGGMHHTALRFRRGFEAAHGSRRVPACGDAAISIMLRATTARDGGPARIAPQEISKARLRRSALTSAQGFDRNSPHYPERC